MILMTLVIGLLRSWIAGKTRSEILGAYGR